MSTTTTHDAKDETGASKAHRHHHHHRDDYRHLETLDHFGLVHDKDDHLTPVDALFNIKESSPKPKHEPREVL
jgi:hypothetical protein